VKRAIILGKAAAHELEERLSYLRDARPGADERLASELTRLLNLVSEFPHLHAPFGRTLRRAVLEQWSLGVSIGRMLATSSSLPSSTSAAIRLPSGVGLGYMKGRQNSFRVRQWYSRQAYPLVPTFG
jgi:hypothetical protein